MTWRTSPTIAEQSAPTINRRPWNRGRLIGQKPPLKLREVWAIRTRLQLADRVRDLALFNVAIDSKLRGCDIVALRVDDVELSGHVRPRTTVLQKKTGRPVQFEIMEQTRSAVQDWITRAARKPGDYLFPSRVRKDRPLGTRHYARLVDRWVSSIGLDPALYGTHSLRRTKVAMIYRRTGNLRRPYPSSIDRSSARQGSTIVCCEYCRLGRNRAEKKKASGRGKHASWVISHDELLRFQRDGLLPDRRRQPNTASTA